MLMQIIHTVNDFFSKLFPFLPEIKVANPNKKEYIISRIADKRFSGKQVLAYYYVSWAISMPEQVQHLGLDFIDEYEMAKKLK